MTDPLREALEEATNRLCMLRDGITSQYGIKETVEKCHAALSSSPGGWVSVEERNGKLPNHDGLVPCLWVSACGKGWWRDELTCEELLSRIATKAENVPVYFLDAPLPSPPGGE